MHPPRSYLVIGLLCAALVFGLWWFLTDAGERAPAEAPVLVTREGSPSPGAEAFSEEASDTAGPSSGTSLAPAIDLARRAERRREAARLRAAIREAAAQREASHRSAADPHTPRGDAGRGGSIEAEYIRDAVRAIQPLLGECYELALGAARDAGEEPPQGRLVMRFEIVAEPEVGGVVEESEVLEVSDVRHPTLDECFAETLYTLQLPAPEGGGRITVRYPFVLAPNDDPPEGVANAVDPP